MEVNKPLYPVEINIKRPHRSDPWIEKLTEQEKNTWKGLVGSRLSKDVTKPVLKIIIGMCRGYFALCVCCGDKVFDEWWCRGWHWWCMWKRSFPGHFSKGMRARYITLRNTEVRKRSRIDLNEQFLAGNYRGALQEYCAQQGFWLHFWNNKKTDKENKGTKFYYECTCIVDFCPTGEVTATVEAKKRKQSTRLAALAIIKKMKLVSESQL